MDDFYDNDTNISLFNESYFGYEEDELWRTAGYHAFVYTMYAIVFVLAVLGNGVVCYIIVSSSRMRTVRNYFIMNLAVSDIMFIIFCVPASSYEYLNQSFPFPAFLCPTFGFAQSTSVLVSTYTLAAISVDRYMAIMWPLRPRLTKRFAVATILFGWALSACVAAPVGIMSKMEPTHENGTYRCVEEWKNGGDQMYTNLLMILQCVIPFTILLYNYTSIGVMLWCHTIPGEAENCRDQIIARSKRNMIKMMMMVVFVFTICWLPFNILMILMKNNMADSEYIRYVWFGLHWLAMSHAIYNPFIYCYMNSRFRSGFIQVLASLSCVCCSVSQLGQHRSNTSSSGFPLTSVEGTDNTLLHRNNTCTTYISMRAQNGHHHRNHQVPVRSVSVSRTSGSAIGTAARPNHNQILTKPPAASSAVAAARWYSPRVSEGAI